MKRMTV